MYARGGRYACGGGAPARNGAAVASLARRNIGSKNVYFDFGNTCCGLVPADRRSGSSQCRGAESAGMLFLRTGHGPPRRSPWGAAGGGSAVLQAIVSSRTPIEELIPELPEPGA